MNVCMNSTGYVSSSWINFEMNIYHSDQSQVTYFTFKGGNFSYVIN